MNKKYLLFVLFLTLCVFYCSLVVKGCSYDEEEVLYSEILIKVNLLEKLTIQRPTSAKVQDWSIKDGKIHLFTGATVEIYDENSATLIKTLELPRQYRNFVISEDNSIYLLAEDNSHILIIENDLFKQFVIPSDFNDKVKLMQLIMGKPILILLSNESIIFQDNLWKPFAKIDYVGDDGFAYYHESEVIKVYNEKGSLVNEYKKPFDLSPLYAIGVEKNGIQFYFVDPLMDKSEGEDVSIMYLDHKKTIYGFFSIPFGWYRLQDKMIYRLGDQCKHIKGEEIIDVGWNPNLIIITKWEIDGVILY